MESWMHALRDRRVDGRDMSQAAPIRAEKLGSLKRAFLTLVKDFDFLIDYALARHLVWRELRRRRKAEAKRRGQADGGDAPGDAVAGLRRREPERYLTEVAKHRRTDK